MHPRLLHNGEIFNTTEPLIAPGQVGFMNGWGVFSTIRVRRGVLFAFERHYRRMSRDAERLGVPFEVSQWELESALLRLVDANQAYDATLRVAVVRNRGGSYERPGIRRDSDIVAFTTDTVDWGETAKLTYMPNGRFSSSPFAGVKTTSWALNLICYERAHERGFDEVILLNERNEISECTSANVFMIEGENVWTPPLQSSGCLPGVTRAVLIEELQIPGISISERELMPSDLENADQVFITSTTRDLLPVSEIEGEVLSQTPEMLDRLRRAFTEYRNDYVERHRRPLPAIASLHATSSGDD